ncbi:hypothetical protein HHK36_024651 [Tetracentron sinense]|uniref:Uncharacterized protein n=1 Tax=Tetracentron sinense TaxID=13715 RepID=A0A834YJR3_TETSI|nr:hypothetical protein HHK36_024651 [Tetracentron sinense]
MNSIYEDKDLEYDREKPYASHPGNDGFRGFPQGPWPVFHQGPGPLPLHPAARQEELVIQHFRRSLGPETRELVDRGLKLEAELRATEPLKAEVMQLRAEAQNLDGVWKALSAQVQGLTQDLTRLQDNNQKLIVMRSNIDGSCQELVRTRTAFEFEKKANAEQVEHNQAMGKNLISMACEIEKLRAEQLSTEKRARDLVILSLSLSDLIFFVGDPHMV